MHLKFVLPLNRARSGYFVATDEEGSLLAHGRCLGRADNRRAAKMGNPERKPRIPWGDTPTGTYEPTTAIMWALESDTYGKGWIPLTGATGDALAAVEGGRTGIAIHAGRDYTDGRLVPTYGCLRVSSMDFDQIVTAAAGGEILVTVMTEEY